MPQPRIVTPQEAQQAVNDAQDAYDATMGRGGFLPVREPRLVTSVDAQRWVDEPEGFGHGYALTGWSIDLAHTVATEPDRTRAAVVKALQDLAETNFYDGDSDRPCDGYYDLIDRATAIESGANYE